jgi:predicted DNA-binding transcriptional regulator YafY
MNNWLWFVVAAAVIWWLWRQDRHFLYQERADQIFEAIRSEKDVQMTYWAKSSRKYSDRTVTPVALEGVYMRAYDHWRKAERTFKITRIKKMVLIPRKQT